ncbi:LINE-1 type transposase domain-containing protein 1 [Spea bombifrons]|uniref:LINE-1 type transposase domain-containing protein 1 n=1 Tax=Spea bombifrons TaxID=233779 RepID=UPI002349B4FA|nr:LINE-1 type transposase domain-containing protein 1 [Spea bombifrons]
MASKKAPEKSTKRDKREDKKDRAEKRLSFFSPQTSKPEKGRSDIDAAMNRSSSGEEEQHSMTLPPSDPLPQIQEYMNMALDKQFEKIKQEIHLQVQDLRTDFLALAFRVKTNEEKIENLTMMDLIHKDNIKQYDMKIDIIEQKLADIEDQSRRLNLRIRGIAESISKDQLEKYLKEYLLQIGIYQKDQTIVWERCHRTMKPANLPSETPRDIMIYCLDLRTKEKILKAYREATPQEPFLNIKIFPDLSYHTRMKRRQYAHLTEILRQKQIRYRWAFPVKIILTYEYKTWTLDSPENLRKWLIEHKITEAANS